MVKRTNESFQMLQEQMEEERKGKRLQFAQNSVGLTPISGERGRRISRNAVRTLMKNPMGNYQKLQEVSTVLKGANGNYCRLLGYWGNMATYDHIIYPIINPKKENSKEELSNSFYQACVFIEKFNIKYNCKWFAERLLELGELYLYKVEDSRSVIYVEIPSKFCRISRMGNGVLLYSINLKTIDEKVALTLPTEIQSAVESYKKGGKQEDNSEWYEVSDKGIAFNITGNNLPHGYPYLSFLFDKILGVEDFEDLREDITKAENLKLIHQILPVDDTGEVAMDEDEATGYHNATKKNLPRGVCIATNPLKMESISLQTSGNGQGVDFVSKALKGVYDTAGVNIQLFNAEKSTAEVIKKGIVADELLTYRLVKMFENYFNNELQAKKFNGINWGIKLLEVTYFNRDDKIKSTRDNLSVGGSKMEFLATNGNTPMQSYSILKAEQDLGFADLMIPQQTSFTMSSKSEGRPKDGADIKESTEITNESE